MAKIKILLADDHEIVRSGLASMLNSYDDFEVIKEIPNGEKAYQAYTELLPDVLITDMSMPGIGGLEALRRICAKFRNARIIVFSMHENASLAMQAMSAGAKGYVTKSGIARIWLMLFAKLSVARIISVQKWPRKLLCRVSPVLMILPKDSVLENLKCLDYLPKA